MILMYEKETQKGRSKDELITYQQHECHGLRHQCCSGGVFDLYQINYKYFSLLGLICHWNLSQIQILYELYQYLQGHIHNINKRKVNF